MEDYSTGAFVQAFIRLSCDTGYPKILLIDAGSQLIKACETMEFSFRDLKSQLQQNIKLSLIYVQLVAITCMVALKDTRNQKVC